MIWVPCCLRKQPFWVFVAWDRGPHSSCGQPQSINHLSFRTLRSLRSRMEVVGWLWCKHKKGIIHWRSNEDSHIKALAVGKSSLEIEATFAWVAKGSNCGFYEGIGPKSNIWQRMCQLLIVSALSGWKSSPLLFLSLPSLLFLLSYQVNKVRENIMLSLPFQWN